MTMATERPARRVREPGTPPRSVVALASVALVAGTGVALWLLPGGTGAPSAWPGRPSPARVAVSPPATRPHTDRTPGRFSRPSGFVAFVDAARDPLFELPETARPGRVRWFTLGHLTAGPDGCDLEWGRRAEHGGDSVASRLGRLRAAGDDVGLAFGGPSGHEPATTCTDPERLVETYRRAVGAFGAGHIDFEIRAPADRATVLRRADAITALQREVAADGRSLTVSFSLPAGRTGLTRGDEEMLRTTRRRGVEISAVNLLVPIRSAPASHSRLRPLASVVQAAHPQIARSLGGTAVWHRIALTPVLTGSEDLTSADARRLAAFTTRNKMAWLSTRGVSPSTAVTRLLARITR